MTHQSVDLDARLHNARDTEERLTQILATRTGTLKSSELEEKLRKFEARSNRRKPSKRAYRTASVSRRSHSWRAKMGERSSQDVNSALRKGHTAFATLIGLVEAAPSLLLWVGVLGLPAYFLWKKFRH